jgi:hypothetical protein
VRFQVLMVANVKITAFWYIVLCSLIELDWHFGGTHCVHHQRMRQYAPQKHQSTSVRLHGALFKKAIIFHSVVICAYFNKIYIQHSCAMVVCHLWISFAKNNKNLSLVSKIVPGKGGFLALVSNSKTNKFWRFVTMM